MKKKPLLAELYDNSPGPPPFPVMWRISWDGGFCTIYAQTAYEAWVATQPTHHKAFSEVECELLP